MTERIADGETSPIQALMATAARAASAKLGQRTVILEVSELLGITDGFVLTSGNNVRQVRTIADEVRMKIKEAGGPAPLQVEGLDDARWVLLDYGDFVVHVFLDEARDFYDLERLWSDAPRIDWESIAPLTAVNQ